MTQSFIKVMQEACKEITGSQIKPAPVEQAGSCNLCNVGGCLRGNEMIGFKLDLVTELMPCTSITERKENKGLPGPSRSPQPPNSISLPQKPPMRECDDESKVKGKNSGIPGWAREYSDMDGIMFCWTWVIRKPQYHLE
ncbi:hypothetical protein L218DRAFT_943776 [Marasmius fiardii PR-910]|nr:hypothetical protein L218DRAFT_943776 [Marasmius fiardii PR-910]